MSQRESNMRWRHTEGGKQKLREYHKTEKWKQTQRKYRTSEKARERRRLHPEIYKEPSLTGNVCKILKEHATELKNDPERLSTDFICTLSGIKKEKLKD